jgi:hypothetical protein
MLYKILFGITDQNKGQKKLTIKIYKINKD